VSLETVKAHIIHEGTGQILAKPLLSVVPRIGEEIRFAGERYYTVTVVCWVFDEPECPLQRVNIGAKDFTNHPANTEKP
jgi:hypothetical protein